MATHFKSNSKAYAPLDPIFMTNLHMYNVLDEDFVHKFFFMYTESGIYLGSLDSLKKDCFDFIMKDNRIYHTTKAYVDDVFSFDNLGIGNFYGIFKAFFLFCSLVLIIFVIHLFTNFILLRKKRIKKWTNEFRIYLNFQRFVNMKDRIVFCFKIT